VLGVTTPVTKWFEITQVTIQKLHEEYGDEFFSSVKVGKYDILITDRMTQSRCDELKRRINPTDLKVDFSLASLNFKTKETSRFNARDMCMMLVVAAGFDWNEKNWCLKMIEDKF